MKIKDYLRRTRNEIGISQNELAVRLTLRGWTTAKASVGHWERGRNLPPLKDLEFRQALAASLDTDVNTMMEQLDYVVVEDVRSKEARRAAEIVDRLPEDGRNLALDYLSLLEKRYADAL